MKRLSVESMGDKVQGVHLRGDRRNPEPESFRVVFPGGDVDIGACPAPRPALRRRSPPAFDEDWVRSIRDQCAAAGVAFFYKQRAVRGHKIPTPELDGRTWTEFPR